LLAAEQASFRDRGLDFVLVERELPWRVVFKGLVEVAGERHEMIVVYPSTFPHARPEYYVPSLRLPRHQNPLHHNMCVLPTSSEHWRPSMQGGALAREVVPLIDLVHQGGSAMREAEIAQAEPVSAYYPPSLPGCVLVPETALHLPAQAAWGGFKVSARADVKAMQFLLSAVHDADGTLLAEADPPLTRAFVRLAHAGIWFRVNEPPPVADPVELRHAMLDALRSAAGKQALKKIGGDGWLAAVFPEEVRQGVYEDGWLISRPDGTIRASRYSRADLFARIPELAGLAEKTVSVVGLGSLGSHLAHQLACAQVSELRICDHDFVDAGSSVRWIAGVPAAGIPKVSYLEHVLRTNYPYVRIRTFPQKIGAAPLERDQAVDDWTRLLELLEGTDLIVDATAEENVSRALGSTCDELRIPQIYLWSVDGYGGVVARARPPRTGCYHCLSLALADGSIAPPPFRRGERQVVQPRGCADPTFTASAVDLLPLATQAARLAFATLCEGIEDGYPSSAHDAFVLSLRSSDGSLITPHWDAYILDRHPKCPYCTRQG
jgi:molybdopterin/thiamine biosynthesis adenylyltransferase